jgi:hypothetical protein
MRNENELSEGCCVAGSGSLWKRMEGVVGVRWVSLLSVGEVRFGAGLVGDMPNETGAFNASGIGI